MILKFVFQDTDVVPSKQGTLNYSLPGKLLIYACRLNVIINSVPFTLKCSGKLSLKKVHQQRLLSEYQKDSLQQDPKHPRSAKSTSPLERSIYSPLLPARIQASFLHLYLQCRVLWAHERRTWETTSKHSLHQRFFWSTTSLSCTRKCLSTKGVFVYLSQVLKFLPWSQHLDNNTEMPSVVIQSWRKKNCCINPEPLEMWGFFSFQMSFWILSHFSFIKLYYLNDYAFDKGSFKKYNF